MSRWPYTTKGISRGKSLEKVYADNVSIASEVDRKGTMPDWKQEMLRKPSVSIRKGIAWVSLISKSRTASRKHNTA